MIDLKNAKLEDFELIEAPKLDTSKKVRCTFFRVKPGSYKPKYKNRRIADMPKELFHEYFQKGANHGDGSSDHFSFATFLYYSERDTRQSCKLAN